MSSQKLDERRALLNAYAKYSKVEHDVVSSDDGSDSSSMIAEPRLDDEPLSPVPPLLLSLNLKKRTSETTATNKAQTDSNRVNDGACEKKKQLLTPKKRPHVDSVSRFNAAKKTCAVNKKIISNPEGPVEDVVRMLPIDESQNKPMIAKKSCKAPKATDEPAVKLSSRDVKKQRQKGSSSQATHEVASTSLGIGTQVFPHSKTCSETSIEKCPVLNNESSNRNFWFDTVKSDFKEFDYNILLKNTQLTKRQADVLQQSFYQLCRKLSHISDNSYRIIRKNECRDCDFSVSHQCSTLLRNFYTPVTCDAPFRPKSSILCIMCKQFGYFHSHHTKLRYKQSSKSEPCSEYMIKHYRSVSLSCPRCYKNIVIQNPNHDGCHVLTNWVSLEGINQKRFYSEVKNKLNKFGIPNPPPLLKELYVCNTQCCLFFHRCANEE